MTRLLRHVPPFALDRLCAAVGLLLLAPLMLLTACAVCVEDGRPVLFRQQRVGRRGRLFWLYKFRSMRPGASGPEVTATGDHRVSRVGRLLRKYKIDELPQLWNVLCGEMRLVGPRPEVPRFVDPNGAAWQELLATPPGLTDLATLVFRHEESLLEGRDDPERYYREAILPRKLALSVRYQHERSRWRDLVVFALSSVTAVVPALWPIGRREDPDPPDGAGLLERLLWLRVRDGMAHPPSARARMWALAGAVTIAAVAAFLLRFDFNIPRAEWRHLWMALLVWLPVKGAVFRALRVDRASWAHTSIADVSTLVLANVAGSVFGAALMLTVGFPGFPRSIYFIDFCVSLLTTATVPLSIRMLHDAVPRHLRRSPARRRVAIYGAGTAGIMVLREIRSGTDALPYEVCGFIDDNPRLADVRFALAPVLGDGRALPALALQHRLDEVLIAIPSASDAQMAAIREHCRRAGVRCKAIPALADIIQSQGLASQFRDVPAEDLLGRAAVRLDHSRLTQHLAGRVVLVTGAAGSIGSEICRQLAGYGPRTIVGFDQAETPLFQLQQEFLRHHASVPFVPELGSIQHVGRLADVFGAHRPDLVFHAAAFKHVPLMEQHPFEAAENNVLGSLNLAQAASSAGVSGFVMVSSDKAVRPTSVMGATKRLAEVAIRSLQAACPHVTFVSVRFGNVLESNGSVVPIFKAQIARGGPVTVTHPEMQRYFMTIPEASQLVLQAYTMGTPGDIFVLDMGEPVRVLDLANRLIRLSAPDPSAIRVEFTGVRPGEKLYEEMNADGEDTRPTGHEKIHVFGGTTLPWPFVTRQVAALRRACESRDLDRLLKTLQRLVPEYTPSADLVARADADAQARLGVAPPRHTPASASMR